jgi:hypothetical protein
VSKYDKLWKYIIENDKSSMILSFDRIKEVSGIEIDHSFLNYKKELMSYGFSVGKISLKNKTVEFLKTNS